MQLKYDNNADVVRDPGEKLRRNRVGLKPDNGFKYRTALNYLSKMAVN